MDWNKLTYRYCFTEMPPLMVACLCVMVGNAETERCFSCQNHRDVLVDGRLPVRDGGECGDGVARTE